MLPMPLTMTASNNIFTVVIFLLICIDLFSIHFVAEQHWFLCRYLF